MREEFEGELDPVQTTIGDWFYWTPWMQFADTQQRSPKKVLVPLDRSISRTERVLGVAQDLLHPEGEGILLHVIPPSRTKMSGLSIVYGTQVEKHERSRAFGYLNYFANRLNTGSRRWRCEVAVSASVADQIADTADREDVDLIAMYTHDRKGLAKLIKGSITERVLNRALREVRVVRPRELAVQ